MLRGGTETRARAMLDPSRLLLVPLLGLVLQGCAYLDSDCDTTFRIETQMELEAMLHCETITGNLTVIYNVTEFHIRRNPSLASLEGLSNLRHVGFNLNIEDNDCLSQEEATTFASAFDPEWGLTVEDNGADHPCE
jgi:hypothetical protein